MLTASRVAKKWSSRIEEQILKVRLNVLRDCMNGNARN